MRSDEEMVYGLTEVPFAFTGRRDDINGVGLFRQDHLGGVPK